MLRGRERVGSWRRPRGTRTSPDFRCQERPRGPLPASHVAGPRDLARRRGTFSRGRSRSDRPRVAARSCRRGAGGRCRLGARFRERLLGMLFDIEVTRGPYRYARHPFYLGWIAALLGTAIAGAPGAVLTVAILVGVSLARVARTEERFLLEELGNEYATYRRHAPALPLRATPTRRRRRELPHAEPVEPSGSLCHRPRCSDERRRRSGLPTAPRERLNSAPASRHRNSRSEVPRDARSAVPQPWRDAAGTTRRPCAGRRTAPRRRLARSA